MTLGRYARACALAADAGIVVGLSVSGPDPEWLVAWEPETWCVLASERVDGGDVDQAAEYLSMRLGLV